MSGDDAMSNDCTYRSQLDAYHDGEIGAEMSRRIAEHLETCDQCRRDLRAMQQMSALFADSRDDGISLGLVGRVHESVDAEPAGNYFRTARLLIGLAASVLIIGAAWLYEMPAGMTPVAQPPLVVYAHGEPWIEVAVGGPSYIPPNSGLQSPGEETRVAEAQVTQFMLQNLEGGSSHGNP